MPLMRRRPLLRAAAVGGGAYYAGKRRQESQYREMAQEQRLSDLEMQQQAPPVAAQPPPQPAPAAAPAAAPADTSAMIQQLQQLGQLRDQGVLTDEEFAQQKAKLLGT
jgi:Short C-terminal domain